ncbi:MAG: hypothetical protein WAU36_12630 [Cyclobacteriaceae bacterium]
MKTIIVAFMAMFLTMFTNDVKAQYIPCTHSFTDFVLVAGGCDYLCECDYTFQIPTNLNPSLYNLEVWRNHVQQFNFGATPVHLAYGDIICFYLKHPNNDIEECCFDVSDFCY